MFPIMDGWTIGADIAAMLTSLSVVTATVTWVGGRWRGWRQERAAIALRNWHGYILPGTINEWNVRLVERPETVSAKVVLEVLGSDGQPDGSRATSMLTVIDRDGMLSRAPTPEESDFLKALWKARRATGFPVGSNPDELGFWPR